MNRVIYQKDKYFPFVFLTSFVIPFFIIQMVTIPTWNSEEVYPSRSRRNRERANMESFGMSMRPGYCCPGPGGIYYPSSIRIIQLGGIRSTRKEADDPLPTIYDNYLLITMFSP